jgi:transposase
VLRLDPESGALFLFTGKRATTLKALWWDKTGYCILYKRLTRGMFRMPAAAADATSVLIDPRELALILEGIELPSKKLKVKAAARESRRKALRAIDSMITQPGA